MNPDYSARKRGLPTMPITERIKRNITINPITKCWEWNGSKRRGYGRMIVGNGKLFCYKCSDYEPKKQEG